MSVDDVHSRAVPSNDAVNMMLCSGLGCTETAETARGCAARVAERVPAKT